MRRIVVAVVGVLVLSGAARADLLVNISKSQQKLPVSVEGVEAFRWPTSTGRRGHDPLRHLLADPARAALVLP